MIVSFQLQEISITIAEQQVEQRDHVFCTDVRYSVLRNLVRYTIVESHVLAIVICLGADARV